MRPNRLRELLRAGSPTLGTHLAISWPSIVELVGHSGMFDYVEFVAEYAPYDLYALENLGRAIDLFPHMTGMTKIEQQPRTYLTVRAIGSGIQNVLFADVRTVADAEECVRATRAESPATRGIHGVGMRRDVGFVLDVGTPAFVQALDDAVVALMIEKKRPEAVARTTTPGQAGQGRTGTVDRTTTTLDRNADVFKALSNITPVIRARYSKASADSARSAARTTRPEPGRPRISCGEVSVKRSTFEREWLIGQENAALRVSVGRGPGTVEAHLCERMLGGHDARDG